MKRLLYIFIILWLPISVAASFALETIIVGEIYDNNTGTPIPNVNIFIQGTKVGTYSTAEGMFLLRVEIEKTQTLVASAVGYHTQKFKIEPGQHAGIQIALEEKMNSLGEVFVVPGANPALPLMEKVRENRLSNAREAITYEQETALYVSDIQSKHLKRQLWKSLEKGMLAQEDSTYLIPLYWRQEKLDSTQEKATLLTATDYQTILQQMPHTFDFYQNHITLISATMLSPLAAAGNMYYNYYLVDSIQAEGEKHYQLHFRTKNPFAPTFNGKMTIDSATYALRDIQVNLPTQSSINFLKEFTIHQSFTSDNQLQEEQTSILLDFAVKLDTSHIFPTLLLTRHSNCETTSNTPIQTVSTLRIGAESLHPAMDSISNTPLFLTAKFLAYILQSGNIPTSKYVEIGKLHHFIRLNQEEGLRIGIPLQTTEALWKDVSLEAMAAYGTGDRAWKGLGKISINLPTERRHIMRLSYTDEYTLADIDDFQEYIRENVIFNPQIHMITRLMQFATFNRDLYYNTMAREQEARIAFEDDWNDYLETKAYFKIGRMGYGEPTSNYHAQPSFAYTTLGAFARISFNERKVDTYFHRRHIYNNKPVIYIGAEIGSYQLTDMPSYRMYGNLQLMLRHNVDLGMAGHLHYLAQAGVTFGQVPYPLLHLFSGNQTYTFDPYRFSMMNNYQYAADKYLSLQANWNGGGVLFNQIPGLKYLRLRELLEVKMAWGGLNDKHKSVIDFPKLSHNTQTNYSLLTAPTVPYVELGVGIGNIFRLGELYSVWRLTHLKDAYTPYWSMRFRLFLGL